MYRNAKQHLPFILRLNEEEYEEEICDAWRMRT
jgi:hypothetical protein